MGLLSLRGFLINQVMLFFPGNENILNELMMMDFQFKEKEQSNKVKEFIAHLHTAVYKFI